MGRVSRGEDARGGTIIARVAQNFTSIETFSSFICLVSIITRMSDGLV
jgi:hypothetical protein